MKCDDTAIVSIVLVAAMTLSVVAMPMAGAAGGAAPGESIDPITTESVDGIADDRSSPATVGDRSPSDGESSEAYVDPALRNATGTTQVLIDLEQPGADVRSGDDAVATLQRQTERSQAPVLDSLGTMDGVSVTNTFWITNMIVADVDADGGAIDRLATLDGVESILLSREVALPEPASGDAEDDEYTYGLEQINVPELRSDLGARGQNTRVAVIDNGIDPSHPDLDLYTEDPSDPTYPGGFAVFDGEGERVEGLEPRSAGGQAAGHGDHTSGTVGADPAPDSGVPSYGVAPETDLLHADVFRMNGTDATVIAAMEWAAERDVDAVSMSLGFGCTSRFNPEPVYIQSLLEPVENLREAGAVPVISTGNAGEGCVGAPGNHYDSFGIGATNEQESVTSFSSGDVIQKDGWDSPPADWPDSFVKPDVVAPGYSVFSAAADGSGYAERSGTSMAAPHVSGAVALLRSLRPNASVSEIESALEETARKPDGEPDEPDTRYGSGIVDVRAAATELGGEVTLGDVTGDGEVDVDDVIKIQQHIAGVEPEGAFAPERADLDRDGEVGVGDVILAQRVIVGLADGSTLEVTDLEVPAEVDGGDTIEVAATINNTGDVGALEYVDLHLAEEPGSGAEDTRVARTFVDVATAGVDDPADRPAETTVEFEVATDDLQGTEYSLGAFTNDDERWNETTVRKPFFEVTNVSAAPAVDRGDAVPVTVDLENTGNDVGSQDVVYRLENHLDETEIELVAENVTLEAGENTSVEFDVETDDLDGGEYEHVATTANDDAAKPLTVREAHFDVSDVQGPDGVFVGDEYNVTATVENVGDAPAEQTLDYRLDDAGVAVVDVAYDDSQGAETAAVLEDERFAVDVVHARNVTDVMDEYDAFVVQRFGNESIARTFLDNLEEQGVVYLGSFQGTSTWEWADGIERLQEIRENPGVHREASSNASADPATLEIDVDHPIFEGVGDPGESVEMYQTEYGESWGAWFDDYDGQVLGEIDLGNGQGGPSVAVGDEGTEALVSAATRTGGTEWTSEEADRLLANALEFVTTGNVTPEASANAVQTSVQLDPGNATTVEFEHTVPEGHATGDSLHVVRSDDDVAATDVQVRDDDYFEIVDLEDVGSVEQTETYTVNATIRNDGLEAGTQTVEYLFNGTVVDESEAISLDVGEEATVEFEHTVDDYETPGETEYGVRTDLDESSEALEVIEIDDADFEVSIEDAPASAGQQEQITVNATVTNAGDRTDTQTIGYEFVPSNVSVALVDDDPSTHGVATAASDLDARLGDSHDVEAFDVSERDLLAEMDDYDVLVVNNFGDTDVAAFDDALDGQGVVYLDAWDTMDGDEGPTDVAANGVQLIAEHRDDPTGLTVESGPQDTWYEITEAHPLWEGVGEVGDRIDLLDSGLNLHFEGYASGTVVGTSGQSSTSPDGAAVGVSDDGSEVVLSTNGYASYSTYGDYTDDAQAVLANAIDHVGSQTTAADVENAALSPTSTTREVTLEGGENESVTFATELPLSTDLGTYRHRVSSANHTATQQFAVDDAVTAIRGTVTDRETGEPIDGATITIDGDAQFEAETGADGEYFQEIPFGPDEGPKHFVVSADAEGYRSEAVVTLEYDDVHEEDFQLDSIGGNITGTVTDADTGEPVPNATVYDADGNAFEVETDADGTYTVPDLAEGTYAVRVAAENYEVSDVEFVTVEDGDAQLDVEIDPVANVTIEDQAAQEAVTVAGTAYHSADYEVAVYDAGAEPGTDDPLGTRSLDAGVHQNVTVSLAEELTENTTVRAVLEVDGEPITREGEPVGDEAAISLPEPADYEVTIAGTTAPVVEGENLDVSATVENVGDRSGNQTIALEIDGAVEDDHPGLELDPGANETVTLTWETAEGDAGNATATVSSADDDASANVTVQEADDVASVAVVGTEHHTDVASTLGGELGGLYDVTALDAGNLTDRMDQHDVFVVNNFGGADVQSYLDNLSDQGAVYLDAHEDNGANGITALSDTRGDPSEIYADSQGTGDLYYEVTQDHPIFGDLPGEDDQIVLSSDTYASYRMWFGGYNGTTHAEVGVGVGTDGSGFAISDDGTEVLFASLGRFDYFGDDAFTDDANALLANAVEHVDGQASSDERASNGTERTADALTGSPVAPLAG